MIGQEEKTPAARATLISMKNASVTLVPIKFWPGCKFCRSGETTKPKTDAEKKEQMLDAITMAKADLSKHQRSSSRCSVSVILESLATIPNHAAKLQKRGRLQALPLSRSQEPKQLRYYLVFASSFFSPAFSGAASFIGSPAF